MKQKYLRLLDPETGICTVCGLNCGPTLEVMKESEKEHIKYHNAFLKQKYEEEIAEDNPGFLWCTSLDAKYKKNKAYDELLKVIKRNPKCDIKYINDVIENNCMEILWYTYNFRDGYIHYDEQRCTFKEFCENTKPGVLFWLRYDALWDSELEFPENDFSKRLIKQLNKKFKQI